MWVNYHTKVQNYKGIELKLIAKMDYSTRKAKCFRINQTDEVLWIPNKHLEIDGKIKSYQNLDYVLQNQAEVLAQAGVALPLHKKTEEEV